MRNDRRIVMIIFTLVLVILVGCENSSSESSANSNNESSNNTAAQDSDDNVSNKNLTDVQKDTTENSSVDVEKSANNAGKVDTDSKDENPITNDTNTILLKKLNDTKNEVDELEASDSSTFALKKVENERWEIWDELLNEIYGVLKEQLPPDEMERLREKQRNWINYRDDSALAASQEYKGGTQEHLEYVSVLANLTEERCYELVDNYNP
ncbi:lysozyme inhibitor LprI family protein [Solibacillus silvestris]|uniref:lysozyme inhibitor LprI family protein n=1 Tax=Solibacillus silvestris TaxID=76853 RepID=UPI003F7EB43F